MKQLNHRIVPLRTEVADAARAALASGAPDHALVIADLPDGYPCRHCLEWAAPGDEVILFPFAAIDQGPYRETGPIFVHAQPCPRHRETQEFPRHLREGRVIRVYDQRKLMIDARVVNGVGPELVIEELLLTNPDAAFLHVRSATRGCYTLGVERV